jgi:sugar lactone lactonase YvrE
VYVYDVLPSGRLTNKNFLLATASFDAPYRPVIPDGIKVDMDGRIYLGVADGVQGQRISAYFPASVRRFLWLRAKKVLIFSALRQLKKSSL